MKDLILSSVYYLKFEKVAKSVYYYWLERFKQPSKDEELIETIKSICEECGYIYVYRRVTQSLSSKGIKVDHKKVRKLMKELKLTCTKFTHRGRKYRSYKGNVGKIAKHLLKQRFNTDRPFQKVVTDITEFKLNNGSKLYLSVYMDLYNSEIMNYSISSRPTLDMAITPLKEVLNICPNVNYRLTFRPRLLYQNAKYVNILKVNKVFQSMSRKGNCLDNSVMENFWIIETRNILWRKI